jgi:hypothetical protein
VSKRLLFPPSLTLVASNIVSLSVPYTNPVSKLAYLGEAKFIYLLSPDLISPLKIGPNILMYIFLEHIVL